MAKKIPRQPASKLPVRMPTAVPNRGVRRLAIGATLIVGGAVSAYFATRESEPTGPLATIAKTGGHDFRRGPLTLEIHGRKRQFPRDELFLLEWTAPQPGSRGLDYFPEIDRTNGRAVRLRVSQYEKLSVVHRTQPDFFPSWPAIRPPAKEPVTIVYSQSVQSQNAGADAGGTTEAKSTGIIFIGTDLLTAGANDAMADFQADTFSVSSTQRTIGQSANPIRDQLKRGLQAKGLVFGDLLTGHVERHELGHVALSDRFAPEFVPFIERLVPSPSLPDLPTAPEQIDELGAEFAAMREAFRTLDSETKRLVCLAQILLAIKEDWAVQSPGPNQAFNSPYTPDAALYLKHARKDEHGEWQFDFQAIEAGMERFVAYAKNYVEHFSRTYIRPLACRKFGCDDHQLDQVIATRVETIEKERGYTTKEAQTTLWYEFVDGLTQEEALVIWQRAAIQDAVNMQRDLAGMMGYTATAPGNAKDISPEAYFRGLLAELNRLR